MVRRYYTNYNVRLVLHCVQLLVSTRWANRKAETDIKAAQGHTQVIRRVLPSSQKNQSFPVREYRRATHKGFPSPKTRLSVLFWCTPIQQRVWWARLGCMSLVGPGQARRKTIDIEVGNNKTPQYNKMEAMDIQSYRSNPLT